jgi:hypothetical protein
VEVKYYDERGFRVPAPRKDSTEPKGLILGVGIAIVATLLAMAIALHVYRQETKKPVEHRVTHDSMCAVHTYDGETIRFYVMTDPDTQIQYIVNDRGGMCVRESASDDGL